MAVTAFAPVSSGNVSVGFDILGVALAPISGELFGDLVKVEDSQGEFELLVSGRFADKLPGSPKDNIVYSCYQAFTKILSDRQVSVPAVKITLDKNLPVGSGLGSSACSIVAAVAALNKFFDHPLSDNEALLLMGELEGSISGSVHYDNVAPTFLGGLQLMTGLPDNVSQKVPSFDDWYWTLTYSGLNVSTSAARDILPKSISMGTAITFARQLSAFVDACHKQDELSCFALLNDVIAEPHRKHLLPGFDEARQQSLALGARAFGISGSGPTVFSVCKTLAEATKVSDWLSQHYVQNESGFSHVCKIDKHGTRFLEA